MFKKWSILLFAVFLLAGCGEKAAETTTTEKTVSTIKTEPTTKNQVTIEQMKLSKKEKNLLEAATTNESGSDTERINEEEQEYYVYREPLQKWPISE